MPKFKLHRKLTSSPQSLAKMQMIINAQWTETWNIVGERAQTPQPIDRQD